MPDGRWKLSQNYTGRVFFKIEKVGQLSRWNTLADPCVEEWWENRL